MLEGESLEDVPAFTAIIAQYAGREIWFSDEVTTLVVDPLDGSWRLAVGGVTAFYYEPDTELLTASFNHRVVVIEPPNVTLDVDTAIPFQVQTRGSLSDVAVEGLIARLYLEVDTAGQLLTPTLILDDAEIPLPPFTTLGRPPHPPEWSIGRWGRVVAVRLEGALIRQVTVFGIELDVYVPTTDAVMEPAT